MAIRFSDFIKSNEEAARSLLTSESVRVFLKTFFQIKKNLNPTYSYAVFARQADLSKSLPRDIIEGLKRITEKTLPNFLKAMELEGLLQEYFIQLVQAEKDPTRMKLARKVADLYIETHFTRTYTDNNFQDYRSPFLYAASGEVGKGSSLQMMAKRTGIPVEKIKEAIPHLEQLKLGTYHPEKETFIPYTPQVHVGASQRATHFQSFYQYCLALQKESVQKRFHHPDSFFYNEVFSVHQKDLEKMKAELQNVIKSFLIKAENPEGDSVAVFNLGLFKQTFSDS